MTDPYVCYLKIVMCWSKFFLIFEKEKTLFCMRCIAVEAYSVLEFLKNKSLFLHTSLNQEGFLVLLQRVSRSTVLKQNRFFSCPISQISRTFGSRYFYLNFFAFSLEIRDLRHEIWDKTCSYK